jgi:GxxExxY protein
MRAQNTTKLLYPELSYKLQGVCIAVRKFLGTGHKESVYHRALIEEFEKHEIKFEHEPRIVVKSNSGRMLGYYQPDFVIDGKIVLEVKAIYPLHQRFVNQLFDYLRNCDYELGYFVNFAGPHLYMKRIIYTNDRKQNLRGS